MSDLIELFKSLKSDIEVSPMSYVYFDNNSGKINKITNRRKNESEQDVLEVSYTEVKDILEGRRSTTDYIVSYDLSLKQLALKEITYENSLNQVESLLHRLPVTRDFYDPDDPVKDRVYEEIYDGVDVVMYVPGEKYTENSLVWYDNNVYRFKKDFAGNEFDKKAAKVFIKDVSITEEKSVLTLVEVETHKKEYEGVFVDVWYEELNHLAGQNVWYKNTVYKILKDQKKNTKFNKKNAEVVVKDVKLYSDSNDKLDFESISQGDLYLDNNQIYSFNHKRVDHAAESSNKAVVFYINDKEFLIYNSDGKNFLRVSTIEKNGILEFAYETTNIKATNLTPLSALKKGDKVLLGKKLVTISDFDADIIVIQNKKTRQWSVRLSNSTRKFLQNSSYNAQDKMFFSITAKYDPNILYRNLEFTLSDILLKTRVYDFEHDIEDTDEVSVYTTKFFDTYTHEVLT